MSVFNLLKLDYWFSQPYVAYGNVKWFWVILFLALVLAGLIGKMIQNYQNEQARQALWQRFSNLGLTVGLLGIIWLFFRQERVPFLAWRFWLLILMVAAAVWLTKLIIYAFKRLPEIKAEKQERELKNKYLPK